MPDRLDRRQLSRATLARQLLLERKDMAPIDAVERLVGLQSQAPLAHYVGLWSRLQPFDPAAAGAALANGDLVRTHAMRATIHLFSRRDAVGLRALAQPMLAVRFGSTPFVTDLPGVDLGAVCAAARELTVHEPLGRRDLGRRLGERFSGMPESSLAYAAVYLEPMVQVPPRGVWGHRAPVRWQAFRGWLDVDADQPASIDDVMLRYLGAFGPASVADMRAWSGLSGLGEVADRLAPRLRRFVDDNGRELLDLADAPRPDPDTPAPVRFLPEYDNVLLAHQDRSRINPDRRAVPLPPGDGARAGTVLVDGDFRGLWHVQQPSVSEGTATLTVRCTPTLSSGEATDVTDEGERLLAFLAPDAFTYRVDIGDGPAP